MTRPSPNSLKKAWRRSSAVKTEPIANSLRISPVPKHAVKSATEPYLPGLLVTLALLFSAALPALEPAADQDPKVLMKQAAMYLHGQGVEPDVDRAIELYRAAADQDVTFAQYRLARLYLDGERVERDLEKALTWLHRAAALGFVEAQLMLSRLYGAGDGIEADYVSAWKWLHIADSLSDLDVEADKQALQEKMSFLQLIRAKYLARRCIYRGYKNC